VTHLAFIFCCVVWGSSFILLERVTHVMGPVGICIWRMVLGALVTGFVWWYHRREYHFQGRDLLWATCSSLLFTAPASVIQAYVLAQGFGHSFFGTMVAAIPLLTILVSIPLLRVGPSGRELFGVLGGLACIFLLVEEGMHRGMSMDLLALTLLIPLSSALSNTFIKWRLPHVPAAPLTTMLLAVSAVALLPVQLLPGVTDSLHIAAPAGSVMTLDAAIYLALLGVIGSGVSTMVFVWIVLKRGPLFAGMTTYVVPVLAMLWGTLDHESISPMQMASIAGVLAMVALVHLGARDPNDVVEPAAAGDIVTALPLSAEVEDLVTLPVADIALNDPLATQPESQVA
jgi:drug/metabolite transporter (DMT)-like permease